VNPVLRGLMAVSLLLLGAATGIAAVFVHRMAWGLALGLAATALTAYALPPGWSTRLPFVLGFVAAVGWLTVPRPEGDYVVSENWQGYTLLGFTMVLLVTGLATLPRPRRRAPAAT
jgi:hypothetical protein